MAEPTVEQKLEDALNQIATLKEQAEESAATNKRLTDQLGELQANIGTAKDLPPEVLADARERIANGIPRETAIERAIHQHEHNKKRHESLPESAQTRAAELVKKEKLNQADAITRAKYEHDLTASKAVATTTEIGKGKK